MAALGYKKIYGVEFTMRDGRTVTIADRDGDEVEMNGVDEDTEWFEVGPYGLGHREDGYYALGGASKSDCIAWRYVDVD